ncbi:MAG: hypothetical protein WA045_07300 [Nitrospira sp.]
MAETSILFQRWLPMRYPIILGMVVLGVLLFLWERHRHAPAHVSNTAYDLLLSTLLSHSVPEVSVEQIESGQYRVLDARAYREFEVSHIAGTTWVGYDDFDLPDWPELLHTHQWQSIVRWGTAASGSRNDCSNKDIPMSTMSTAASSNGSTQSTLS